MGPQRELLIDFRGLSLAHEGYAGNAPGLTNQ